MKKLIFIFCVLFSGNIYNYSQTISGTLTNEKAEALQGILNVMQDSDSTRISEYTIIHQGHFELKLTQSYEVLRLQFRFIHKNSTHISVQFNFLFHAYTPQFLFHFHFKTKNLPQKT
ncbi:MAG: hypothetical protein Q4G27_09280 [Flavobacteriaceae bacterium]|nr:hypothetical protein [Flavobacteriaceae bacterium]